MATLATVACASGDSSADGSDTSEDALIPAQLFSATCTVSIPAADGTVGTGAVSGRFRVESGGTLSAANDEPVRITLPKKEEQTAKLRSGRVLDAENDVFELTVSYGIFKVGVRYDGSKALGNKQNVRIDVPIKGPATYDGTCKFTDESGRSADGKVGPPS